MSQEVSEEKKPAEKTTEVTVVDPKKMDLKGAEPTWVPEMIEWLAIPKDLRYPKTVVEFCDKMGIRRDQYYYEVEKPEFQQRLLKRMRSIVKDRAPEVFDKLLHNAIEGETKAIELYMKYIMEIAEKIDHTGEIQGKGFTLNIIQANKNEGGKLEPDQQTK